MCDDYREPPLSLMLEDPLTQALMESDRVDPRALDTLIVEARERIAAADRQGDPDHRRR